MRLRAILILAIMAISAAAQIPQLRVSLRELTGEAIKNNPDIAAAQKRYEAARQRPTQQSTLPDPMISLGYNSVGNPLPGSGLGKDVLANAGVMVSQEIPAPGKLKLKGEMASKEAQVEFQQYQAVQLAVISRLKQAYYRLQYTYAASNLLARNRDLLDKLLKAPAATSRRQQKAKCGCGQRLLCRLSRSAAGKSLCPSEIPHAAGSLATFQPQPKAVRYR